MDTATYERAASWLRAPFDEETQHLVKELIATDPKKLEDCFYADLSFGTGGLRGLMDVGTSRMNLYTVRKATLGLANYLKKVFSEKISVVIGFDSRHYSDTFAKEAAETLIQSGIDVFFLQELRPTPYISFACRYFKAKAAIMITASHNPKEYNGYKVYWQDGAQVVAPHDVGILKEVNALTHYERPKSSHPGTLHLVGEELDASYLQAIAPLQNFPEEDQRLGSSLKIVYTSLHGTGITIVPKALQQWGFTHVDLVQEQCLPDGSFPTVKVPNPETLEALSLGVKKLQATHSDILLATDPDADRLAVALLHEGSPIYLTGNQTAAICLEWLCQIYKHKGILSSNYAAITTVVSTDLIRHIAAHYGITYVEVLTGFKYIAEKIHTWEKAQDKSPHFLFGAEESYGYLYGTHARDKDAIILCCLIAEIALWAKIQGKTLLDLLYDLYKTYGIVREGVASIEFSAGKEGLAKMQNLMEHLRASPPKKLLELPITASQDYLNTALTGLPKTDALSFTLQGGSKVIFRPSGTEPKLKIYASLAKESTNFSKDKIEEADAELAKLLKSAKEELLKR